VFDRLSTAPVPVKTLKADFYNLKPGSPVSIGNILFEKIETESAKKEALAAAAGKPAPKVVKKAEPVEEDPNQVDFTKMDFRVGVISKVWHHETAERLFCEEIDIGEDQPRPVASGLRQYYTLEEMQGRRVIVVCNLKESKLQGFLSFGMVLAAKTDDKIVLLQPPAGAAVGDRVYISDLKEGDVGGGLPLAAARVKKLKIWEAVSPDLKTDSTGAACWKNRAMLVAGEPIIASNAPNAPIS
jgi:methionine--tRNA ligase beta chain